MPAVADEFGLEPVSTTEDFGLEPVSEKEDFGLEPAPVDSGQSRTASAVNRFLQTIQSDTGAMTSGLARARAGAAGSRSAITAATARQLALQGAMADEAIPEIQSQTTPETRAKAAEADPLFQTGRRIQEAAKEVFPTNPRFADSGLEAVASGLGSVVSLAPATLAGPAAPLVAGASYGLNAGEQAISEAGQIIDGRIAEAMAAGDFDAAEELSKDKARLQENAGIKNAVIGAVTEGALGVAGRVIPLGKGRTLGKTFNKTIEKAIPRSIGPMARAATKSAAEGAVREGVQETTEQIAQNMAALEYDPDREILEGIGMAGGAGGAVGAIVGGGAGGLGRLNRRLKARERLMNQRADARETVADTADPNDAEQAADVQEALGALPLAAEALKGMEAKAPEADKTAPPVEPAPEPAPILSARPVEEVAATAGPNPNDAQPTPPEAITSPVVEAPLVEGDALPAINQEAPNDLTKPSDIPSPEGERALLIDAPGVSPQEATLSPADAGVIEPTPVEDSPELIAARDRARAADAEVDRLKESAPPPNPIGPWDAHQKQLSQAENAATGAHGTVARLEQQALNAKLGTPESVKPVAPVTNKTLKVQKDYLLSAVDQAIEAATDNPQKEVVFDVPGDGVFKVSGDPQALKTFRDKVAKKFPSTIPQGDMPGLSSTKARSVPALGTVKSADAVKAMQPFVTTDDTRYVLKNVNDEGSELVATDGRQLAVVFTGKPTTESKPIGPAKDVGAYPNWRQVTPKWGDVELLAPRIDTKALWHIANEAALFWKGLKRANDETSPMKLGVNPDGTIGGTVEAPGGESFTSNIQPGNVMVANLDADYVRDAVALARNLGDTEIDIYGKDSFSPAVIRGSKSVNVIMPLRLTEKAAVDYKPAKGRAAHPGWSVSADPTPRQAPKTEAKPKRKGKKGEYAIDFEEEPAQRPNLFDPSLTDEEIAAFFDPDPAPGRPGEARPTSRLSFTTYEEFRDWMNARFAENDLDGMTDGIKDSSSAFKVRYIKETRGGDPNLRDVLSHLATVSPLPSGWAPVARTTPRPNPPSMGGSRAPTATTPPPSRPAGPPPPPRTPTPYEKFSIPALVQLHRLFGKYPRINRAIKSAYGHFKGGEVALKQRLLWDKELATRVLSHEIGHFIDLAIEKFGKGRQFANRWQPLRSFKKAIADKIAIRRAAVSLSRDWRGPFRDGDPYRDSADELFADAMSAILTNPQWVSDRHPIIHDTFHGLLTGKPAFKTAYDQVTAWLQGDELAAVASGQMRSGFQESRRKLAEGEKRMLGKPIDWLKQLFVDPWFRVADIEGNPRELGKRGLDILGSLRALPARMNALMKDDFIKSVQPFLDKIQGGGEKARDIFAEFLVANRVINERRAAGQWIERNPDDAYKLIEEILKAHAGLRSKWGGEFAALGSNPTGTQLYDFAAAMFREVHDGGEAMVKSVADTIDDLKLGVSGDAALLAFNVRGKLLNPSGLDVNEAQNILNRIDSALTPTERADLNQAARGFYDIAHKTMEMAHDIGLISDKAWNEIVLPNRYNYVPFAVAEYWDGHVGAAMKPQYGTAKDVIDPVIALQQKLSSMHRWIQRQAQVQALIQVYANGGHTVTPTKRLQQVSDIHKERAKERNGDTSMLVLWKNGQPYLVEFPNDPMHSFETAMERPFAAADFARMWYSSQLGFIPEASGWMLALYTTLSPSFFLFRNPIRDAKTTGQHIGYSRTARAANQIQEIGKLGANYARAGYGKPMDQEVRALVEKGVLPPPRSHNLIANSPEELEQLMLRGRVMASEIALYRNSRRHGRLAKAVQPILEKADIITGTFEAASKIIAYRAAKLKPGISEEKAIALAKRSGIPMPGIQGTSSWLVEMVLPWTRVHIQGVRSTFDIAKDPEMGKEFMARVAMFEFAPRLAKYLFASGLAGMVLGGGDDEEAQDGVAGTFGEFFRRASPYKIAVDDLIPLAWFDTRTGQYHPLSDTFAMKAKNIPKHWEAVSFRPPSSEEGKLWGSLFYGILAGTTPKQTGRGGQGVGGNAMDWITSQGVTGENPAGKAVVNALRMEFSGNQRDDFRGRPLANEDLYNAGGIQKQQAILGATLNQGGDAGKLVAMVLESFGLPPEATQPTASTFSGRVKSSLSGNPALSYDNYAQFRDSKVAKDAEEKSRAQIRLLMSPEVREMYDFLNKNRSKVKTLDARDARLYQAALDWHRDVYGSAMQEGTIVNRALAAVEKDGSIKAKETLRRDLAEKSAVYLRVFQGAK